MVGPDLLITVCDPCWRKLKGDREPHRVPHPEQATCAECGKPTASGIYIATHPEVDVAE